MDKKELEKGMEDVKEKKEESKKEESKKEESKKEESKKEESKKDTGGKEDSSAWSPSLDWVMGNVGPFFNNNSGIGELLLDKINEAGINTEGTALAGMVSVLQQFSKEYKMLGEALGDNIERINELSDQSEDLAQAVKDLIKDMGISKEEGARLTAEGDDGASGDMGGVPPAGDMGGVPPAGDMGGMPPAGDMGGVPPAGDMGGVPPAGDMGGASPAGDMGGMTPDMGGVPPAGDMVAPAGMVSDESMKDVKKYVLSDEQLKHVVRKMSDAYKMKKGSTRIDGGIISACSRRD